MSLTADVPDVGRRRVDPGSVVTVVLGGRVDDDAAGVSLVATIPDGWSVVEPAGTVDLAAGTVTWDEGALASGVEVTETVRLRAPLTSSAGRPAFDAVLGARLEHSAGLLDAALVRIRVAPVIIVEHVALAPIDDPGQEPAYLAVDTPLDGIDRYDVFRIRFQLRNADLLAVSMTPRLQYRSVIDPTWADVPLGKRVAGVPFYVGNEWRPDPDGSGTLPGPELEAIPAADLRIYGRDDDTQEPRPGERLMGSAQPVIIVAGDSYTEVEFTVRITRDIPLGQGFDFRLLDDGRAIPGATAAQARSATEPTLSVTPGQRDGIPVGRPVDAPPVAVSGMDFPLVTPAFSATWPEADATPVYRLAVALPTTPGVEAPNAAPFTSPHTPDVSLVSDTCAVCHRTHVAKGPALLASTSPQSSLCFGCHDGTGSNLDTSAQFTDPAVRANDPATRSYYRHDAVTVPVAPNVHTLTQDNEFGGVSNRHSECADCHNSHNATATPSEQLSDGWTISGRQLAVSGVAVAYDEVTGSPAYTLLDGTAESQPTREYQVCFKCHSGFTTLNPNDGLPPSQHALDKAIELNPATSSYHPVEAAGKNATPQMTWSLSNPSSYKQWSFTVGSTVRCVNCHGDPRAYNATTPPAPGSDLAPHASRYRSLLIQDYRSRVLKGPLEVFDAADSALCFVCHAEQPFVSGNSLQTVFDDHDLHMSTIGEKGPGGLSIDSPGEGGGNALCAECHFRTHGTAQAYNEGDRGNPRLVNFAPNVEPLDGVLRFTKTATGGSCTLVCHGEEHDAEDY